MLRVSITKHGRNMKLGFRLEKDPIGRVYFSKITPDSVLYGTAVHEGMIVCMVNGINCEGTTLNFVSSVIRDAEGGLELGVRNPEESKAIQFDDNSVGGSSSRSVIPASVTPVCDDDDASTLVCVSKMKRRNDQIGLRLHVSKNDASTIKIEKVSPDGIFGDTALRAGMILLRVNNIDVRGWNLYDILNIVRCTTGLLSLEAERIGKNPNKFKVCMQKVGEMGKVVTSQAAKLNAKQWGVVLRTGFVVLLQMNGIDSGFVTEGLGG